MLRFALVPYLNAQPLYEGLQELLPSAQVRHLPPAGVAKALRNHQADVGLVPVFSLFDPGMEDFICLPDTGICAKGEVISVYLAARKPFSEIREIVLDPESRSSAALLRILAPYYFSKDIKFFHTLPGYENEIGGDRAGLIIGDRALKMTEQFPYRLDLSKAWHEFSGFPFVFAVWAIRRNCVSEELVQVLKTTKFNGMQHLDRIAFEWAKANQVAYEIPYRYLKDHIYYNIGAAEHEGLKRFTHLAIAYEFFPPTKEIHYYDTHAYYRPGTIGAGG